MVRIGVRELRQNASKYLDLVKSGEVVEVTERGELVAMLVSPSPAEAARDRLVATGRIVPRKLPFALPASRVKVAPGAISGSEALEEQREERLGVIDA